MGIDDDYRARREEEERAAAEDKEKRSASARLERFLEAADVGDAAKLEELVRGSQQDVDERTEKGATALMVACMNGHAEAADALVRLGADVTIKTEKCGWTPLMFAAARGNAEIIHMLMEAGADKNGAVKYVRGLRPARRVLPHDRHT